jgi:hypothetical protein
MARRGVTLKEKLDAQTNNIVSIVETKAMDPAMKVLLLEAQKEYSNEQFDIWIEKFKGEIN